MSGWRGRQTAPKGLFENHIWKCDCTPRVPAVKLQVKKQGDNRGRWFYKCQHQDGGQCKFFLWEDDAKRREQLALQNNVRTEPASANKTVTTPSRRLRAPSPPPPYTVEAGASNASRKRSRSFVEEGDDFGENDGAEFDAALDRARELAETPSKAARIDAFTTPAKRRLPWVKDDATNGHGLPTPQTGGRSTDLFPTRFTDPGSSFLTPSRFREADEEREGTTEDSASQHFFRSLGTPTPARFRDAIPNGPQGGLSRAVFNLLEDQGIDMGNETKGALATLIAKNSLGTSKTADFLRKSGKAKEAKITELQYRVATLDTELEAQKALVEALRAQVEELGAQPIEL